MLRLSTRLFAAGVLAATLAGVIMDSASAQQPATAAPQPLIQVAK